MSTNAITRHDEARALRLVLSMIEQDNLAAHAVIAEGVDSGRHSQMVVAVARYAADLTEQTVPSPGDQLRSALLRLTADER